MILKTSIANVKLAESSTKCCKLINKVAHFKPDKQLNVLKMRHETEHV